MSETKEVFGKWRTVVTAVSVLVAIAALGWSYFREPQKPSLTASAFIDHFEAPADRSNGLEKFSKLLRITVANNGPKKAEAVEIDFGKGNFIFSIDGGATIEPTKRVAELGALSYGHKLEVRVWADDKVSDRSFTLGDKDRQSIVWIQREATADSTPVWFKILVSVLIIGLITGTVVVIDRIEKFKKAFLKQTGEQIEIEVKRLRAQKAVVEIVTGKSIGGAGSSEGDSPPPDPSIP